MLKVSFVRSEMTFIVPYEKAVTVELWSLEGPQYQKYEKEQERIEVETLLVYCTRWDELKL